MMDCLHVCWRLGELRVHNRDDIWWNKLQREIEIVQLCPDIDLIVTCLYILHGR